MANKNPFDLDNSPCQYEYELLDISIDIDYELPEEDVASFVSEDMPGADDRGNQHQIIYDADGIPMGGTQEEKLIRRDLIHKFIQQWRTAHSDNPCVYNKQLEENIKINQLFLLESVAHSAVQYRSTKAVLKMEEVMTNAKRVGLTPAKNNSNQKPFQQMMIMQYSSEDLGSVKMTVGIRKRTKEKVQYSITAHEPGVEFIDNAIRSDKKDSTKKRKKRS